jgi:O-antigen ligase
MLKLYKPFVVYCIFLIILLQYFQSYMIGKSYIYAQITALSPYVIILFDIAVILYWIQNFKIRKFNSPTIFTNVFLLVFFIAISTILADNFTWIYISEVLIWGFVFYVFFEISNVYPEHIKKQISIFVSFAVLLMILIIFHSFQYNLNSSDGILGNNKAYYALFLFPWILSLRYKKLKISLLILLGIVVAISFKRTILISFLAASFTYFVLDRIVLSKRLRLVAIIPLITFLVVFIIGISFVDDSFNGALSKRFVDISLESEENDRIRIYDEVILLQSKSELTEWVLGHGHNSVAKGTSFELSAHNDWLEILYNYGVIAFVFYLFFHFSMIKFILFLIKIRSQYAPAYGASYVVLLISTFFSNVILYPGHLLLLSAYWGTINGLVFREYKVLKSK